MTLHETIKANIKKAMLEKNQIKLDAVRGAVAAFTNELVAKGKKPTEILDDESAVTVLWRLVKQREDAIRQFRDGGRPELADKEAAERKILESYLPARLTKEEIRKIAEVKKSEMGITDKSKAGMLMGALMKELKGQADGNEVKAVVAELLA